MSLPRLGILLASVVVLLGCSKLAELAGVPTNDFTVKVTLADTVAVGQTVTATATKDSAGQTIVLTAEWRSSNPSVASVDAPGNVTGKAAGQATIFADVGR